MGLTDLSVCDHSINGVKDRQDIYIMFHDKIIEKLDNSTGPTGLRYSAFQLTSTSPREKRFEMFYFPTARIIDLCFLKQASLFSTSPPAYVSTVIPYIFLSLRIHS